MQQRNVPIDFFSWHIYAVEPPKIIERAERLKAMLVKYGYEHAESHLNEWNYVKGWTHEFLYSVKVIHSMKGAAFTMATISAAQQSSIDMLMYYDTRPSVFNGAFDYYTIERLHGYYPLYWYGMFYDMAAEVKAENAIDNLYSLCGVDENGKVLSVITYYTDDDAAPDKAVAVDFGKNGRYEVYLLDEDHKGTLVDTTSDLAFDMTRNSCILIKEL